MISRKGAKETQRRQEEIYIFPCAFASPFASLRETASNRVLQCDRTVHGPT